MIRRIVLFIEEPLSERDYRRFGIEQLERYGFSVEIWDCTRALHPDLDPASIAPGPTFDCPNVRSVATRSELMRALRGLTAEDMPIVWFIYDARRAWFFARVSKAPAGYSVIQVNALPTSFMGAGGRPARTPLAAKIRKFLSPTRMQENLGYLHAKIFQAIPAAWRGILPARFWFAGGEESLRVYHYPRGGSTKIVWTHSFDYDLFRARESTGSPRTVRNIAVFLDEYLPFHPDFALCRIPNPTTPARYYAALRGFFDFVEREQDLEVVIAAHPRSAYEEHPDYFGGRTIERGRTQELISESRFVILHSSTALSFAVLYEKPVVFLSTAEVGSSSLGAGIAGMASWLGKRPVDADAPGAVDWDQELAVDRSLYAQYRPLFIKKEGSPEKPCWAIVAETIRGIS